LPPQAVASHHQNTAGNHADAQWHSDEAVAAWLAKSVTQDVEIIVEMLKAYKKISHESS
jgi:hypothetical protein